MWTLVAFINILLLHVTVSARLPRPIDVAFSSVNLKNVLHWVPGPDTPRNARFTVQYNIYGESVGDKGEQPKWTPVPNCTFIMETWCDLSAETGSLEDGYKARVRAVTQTSRSDWTLTPKRFDPKMDTNFGPPMVFVKVENESAIFTVIGPMRYEPSSGSTPTSLANLFPRLTYDLAIHNTNLNQMDHFVVKHMITYRLLSYNTKYCYSARVVFLSQPARASEWECITTGQDPSIEQLQRVVVGIVVPFLFICVITMVSFLLHQYVTGKGQRNPFTLKTASSPPALLTLPPDHFSLIHSKKEPPPDFSFPEDRPLIIDPPPSYQPQLARPPADPEEFQDDLSVQYGGVGAAPDVSQPEQHPREADWTNVRDDRSGDSCPPSYLPQSEPRVCTAMHLQAAVQTSTGLHVGVISNKRMEFSAPPMVSRVRNPPNSFIGGSLNQQTQTEEKGHIDVSTEDNALLVSGYASQNPMSTPSSPCDDDDGRMSLGSRQPECADTVLGRNQGVLRGLLVVNGVGEANEAGKQEEMYMNRNGLMLESVLVQHNSEDEGEAEPEMWRDEIDYEIDELSTKFGLVIPMD